MAQVYDSGLQRRWFGKFLDWLKRLNQVEAGNEGSLGMGYQESLLLYRARKG